MSKYDGNEKLSAQSTSVKNPPPLISVDDLRMKMIVDHIEMTMGNPSEEFMMSVTPEELRSLYFHYTGRMKANIGHYDYQQGIINTKAKQISQMQNLKRLLEDMKDRFKVSIYVQFLFEKCLARSKPNNSRQRQSNGHVERKCIH